MNDVDEAILYVCVKYWRCGVCSLNIVLFLVEVIFAMWSSFTRRGALAAEMRLWQDQIFLVSLPWGKLLVVQSGRSGHAGPGKLPRGDGLTPGSLRSSGPAWDLRSCVQ